MHVQPYLIFGGRCEEALEFYRGAVGAEVGLLMRFKDNPEPAACDQMPPGSENLVMHTEMKVGDTTVMASDGMPGEDTGGFKGFALALSVADAAAAEKIFGALRAGGKVTMPLGRTFWSPCFGMLVDRFGVSWMITTVA